MAEFEGPWGSLPPPPAAPPPRGPDLGRLVLWIAVLVVAAGAFFLVARLLPRQFSGDDWPEALALFGWLALVARGLVAARSLKLATIARYLAIWTAILALGFAGYVYRGELMRAGLRLRSALLPGYAVQTGGRTLVVGRAADNAFYVIGKVNGAPVRFLIDTGAGEIVLSPKDARRAGLASRSTRFSIPTETAGGVAFGARARIRTLEVGSIRLTNVPCYLNQKPLSVSLLGMPFLKRLESFEVRGDQLFLRAAGAAAPNAGKGRPEGRAPIPAP